MRRARSLVACSSGNPGPPPPCGSPLQRARLSLLLISGGAERSRRLAGTGSKYNAGVIFYAATVLFLANFALGVLVQVGAVDTKPFRWLHHALFFAVFVSAAAAALAGFYWGAPYRWALVPVLGLFVVLPYVRAGTRGHTALACAALGFYAVGLAQSV